jgi:predicted branched-subunit amino acid permease
MVIPEIGVCRPALQVRLSLVGIVPSVHAENSGKCGNVRPEIEKRGYLMQTGCVVAWRWRRSLYRTGAVTLGNFSKNWFNPAGRQFFLAGCRDVAGPLIATSTWGFVTGIAMLKSGLSEAMAGLMTLLVYAGSAQLTALPLLEAAAPVWLIGLAGLVVNIRFLIFGAALHPYYRHLSWPKRFGIGYLTSDIAFVLFMSRYGEPRAEDSTEYIWYMLGMVVPSWFAWMVFSFLGILVGGVIPDSWSLEFAAILALLGVVIPLIKTRPMVVCLMVAGFVSWAGQPLPLRLGLLLAVISGIVAGVFAERMQTRNKVRRH